MVDNSVRMSLSDVHECDQTSFKPGEKPGPGQVLKQAKPSASRGREKPPGFTTIRPIATAIPIGFQSQSTQGIPESKQGPAVSDGIRSNDELNGLPNFQGGPRANKEKKQAQRATASDKPVLLAHSIVGPSAVLTMNCLMLNLKLVDGKAT
jgi:hypothetical protein